MNCPRKLLILLSLSVSPWALAAKTELTAEVGGDSIAGTVRAEASGHTTSQGEVWDAEADGGLRLHLNESRLNQVLLRNLWGGLHAGTGVLRLRLRGGLQTLSWSMVDERLGLGIFQPRDRSDPLRMSPLGMAAVTAGVQWGNLSATLVGIPILVPEFGPAFENKDGIFTYTSPWFDRPGETLEPFGTLTPARYFIQKPSIGDVVANAGAGGILRWSDEESGVKRPSWVQIAYAYKPMNQLLLSYDAALNIGGPTPVVDVNLYPRVVYHHAAAVDAGMALTSDSTIWSGLTYETPVNTRSLSTLLTHQLTTPAAMVAAGLDWNPTRASQMSVSAFRLLGGRTRDQGDLSPSGRSQFEPRYLFESAGKVSVENLWTLGGPRVLGAGGQLVWDFMNGGSIWSGSVSYGWSRTWRAQMSADILIARDPNAPLDSRDFVNTFRTNDRVTFEVSHVF